MQSTNLITPLLDRRGLLKWATGGIGAVALASLLQRDGLARAATSSAASASSAASVHFPPRAKRVIHIIATGGVSQVDSFDYKPELAKRHGQSLGGGEKPDV